MIVIAQRIEVIRALLEDGTQPALTYAALECRLTIEQVCYERLEMSYGHISRADLRKWQPRKVVLQVVEDANEFAASEFTVSMSKTSIPSDSEDLTRQDFESLEYVQIGEQAGLNLNKLGKLWNALSSVALHAKLPAHKGDDVQAYGPSQDVKEKVIDTLNELEKLKSGTILTSAIGTNSIFHCVTCGTEIRRIEKLLRHGQIINCVHPNCNETYLIHKEGGVTSHIRRTAQIFCESCSNEFSVALKLIDKLRFEELLDAKCESCGQITGITLKPVRLKNAKAGDSGDQQVGFAK